MAQYELDGGYGAAAARGNVAQFSFSDTSLLAGA